MVPEGVDVGGLKNADVVIDDDFKEVEELFPQGRIVKRIEGWEVVPVEIWVWVVDGVLFQWVW